MRPRSCYLETSVSCLKKASSTSFTWFGGLKQPPAMTFPPPRQLLSALTCTQAFNRPTCWFNIAHIGEGLGSSFCSEHVVPNKVNWTYTYSIPMKMRTLGATDKHLVYHFGERAQNFKAAFYNKVNIHQYLRKARFLELGKWVMSLPSLLSLRSNFTPVFFFPF